MCADDNSIIIAVSASHKSNWQHTAASAGLGLVDCCRVCTDLMFSAELHNMAPATTGQQLHNMAPAAAAVLLACLLWLHSLLLFWVLCSAPLVQLFVQC
jgi:hypothetical protein